MTDQGAHVATEQEIAIYEALTIGDHDAIEQMRKDAHESDQSPPSAPPPKGWHPPVAQYNIDYQYAWNHYQADHEAPEDEREQATAEAVEAENDEAARNEEIILAEEEVDAEIVDE